MKHKNIFILLFAAFLLFTQSIARPVSADDTECKDAGTCEDQVIDPGEEEELSFEEEAGISITADNTTESVNLDHNIDAENVGADLSALNGGKITLTVDSEEGMVEIYGDEAGVLIETMKSGSSVDITTNSIDSETIGLGIDADDGTSVIVKNDDYIGGDTAVDIINRGGTVNADTGDIRAVVGVSVQTGKGTTTVNTKDISADGNGVVIDVFDVNGDGTAQSPTVKVNVEGDIKDNSNSQPSEDDPGFDPDPIEEEVEPKFTDDGLSEIDVPYDDEESEDVEWETWEEEEEETSDAYAIDNSTGVLVISDIKGADVAVDVTGDISMAYGNEVDAGNDSTVKVTVGGNVETDYGNRISSWDESTVIYNFGGDINAGGKAIDTYSDSGNLNVNVKGNIIAEDSDDGDDETVGIYTNSEGSGSTQITVGNGITVLSEEDGYTAAGINTANIGGNIDIDVSKNVTVTGVETVGVVIDNDPNENVFGDDEEDENEENSASGQKAADLPPVTNVNIHGKVTSKGSKEGTGAEIWNEDGKTSLIVEGDLTGSHTGLKVDAFGTDQNASFADILVTGTISGEKASFIVNDEADNDGTTDDNLNLTVWKIDLTGNQKAAQDEDGNKNDDVAKNIKYIVKIADDSIGKIKAVDADNKDLPDSHEYPYAKQGERIYIVSTDGSPLTAVYNGKDQGQQIALLRDENGRFYLDVPEGGAIWLSVSQQPGPGPEPEGPTNVITFYPIGDLGWLYNRQLPGTGFSASHMTKLPARPQGLNYSPTGLTLQIPELNVSESITIVPENNGEYPVEWLGSEIGLLEQSSLPGKGISVLTGHNHLNTTEAGPFLFIRELEEGDRMMILGKRSRMQSYQVYGNYKIAADGFESIASDIRDNSLVLITCEDESVDGGYLNRRVILAEPL